jgi:hypothetical protein
MKVKIKIFPFKMQYFYINIKTLCKILQILNFYRQDLQSLK